MAGLGYGWGRVGLGLELEGRVGLGLELEGRVGLGLELEGRVGLGLELEGRVGVGLELEGRVGLGLEVEGRVGVGLGLRLSIQFFCSTGAGTAVSNRAGVLSSLQLPPHTTGEGGEQYSTA